MDYIKHIDKILSDTNKFSKVSVSENKYLNFIIGIEKQITDLLLKLKKLGIFTEDYSKKIKPIGSRFGILYGLCKTHKKTDGKCPPFRPILSALCTPSYKLAKALVSILDPITKNDFTIKNSFEFSKEILEANPKYFMASLDVESLFTNIPLEETIKICSDLLYKNQNLVNSLDKDNFEKLLKTALSNNYFLFDGKVYQQIEGVSFCIIFL